MLGLAYVCVFLIKSQYIKKIQSSDLFTAWTKVGAVSADLDLVLYPRKSSIPLYVKAKLWIGMYFFTNKRISLMEH